MRFVPLLMLALLGSPALAHSPEHFAQLGTANEQWLRGLKNQKGGLCCDGKDGFDAQYDTQDDHYRVFLYDKWWAVPPDAVVQEPNRLGVAQVWYTTYWGVDGKIDRVVIRCFIPGAGI